MARTQKITTHLRFNGNAASAVEFYTSVFPGSRVTNIARWGTSRSRARYGRRAFTKHGCSLPLLAVPE
jgi:predicted 3-demethylubiquinone-9 3-methyltransferase (glyoxalase superfamily)